MAAHAFHLSATHPGKRAMDVVGAAALLVLASPLLLLAGIGILVTSGWPVFHRRRVVGLGGLPFDAFKLRTMVSDADAKLVHSPELMATFQRNFKLDDDPRITRTGALLRRWSIDELPQLVNVLRGQMSLVGPRMVTADELPKFGAFAEQLVTVKPGLSGLWQVRGRQLLDYQARVDLDAEYLRRWSFLGDVRIALRTPSVILSGRGAK